jgi:glutamyl-tRNA synthetase
MINIKSRIAPTPSGFLHIGNILNFILTDRYTRERNGSLLLRIDDIDSDRVKDEYLEDIFKTIEWLGIIIDIGPSGVEDFKKNWSQHNKINRYQEVFNQIKNKYPCNCSRKEIITRTGTNKYDSFCKYQNIIPDPTKNNIRVVSTNDQIEDFIIWKKNNTPSYQLSSLVDDIDYNINFIIRGNDLKESTNIQIYLSSLIEKNYFAKSKFIYHPLINDDTGEKLSKSTLTSGKPLRESCSKKYLYQLISKFT